MPLGQLSGSVVSAEACRCDQLASTKYCPMSGMLIVNVAPLPGWKYALWDALMLPDLSAKSVDAPKQLLVLNLCRLEGRGCHDEAHNSWPNVV